MCENSIWQNGSLVSSFIQSPSKNPKEPWNVINLVMPSREWETTENLFQLQCPSKWSNQLRNKVTVNRKASTVLPMFQCTHTHKHPHIWMKKRQGWEFKRRRWSYSKPVKSVRHCEKQKRKQANKQTMILEHDEKAFFSSFVSQAINTTIFLSNLGLKRITLMDFLLLTFAYVRTFSTTNNH